MAIPLKYGNNPTQTVPQVIAGCRWMVIPEKKHGYDELIIGLYDGISWYILITGILLWCITLIIGISWYIGNQPIIYLLFP